DLDRERMKPPEAMESGAPYRESLAPRQAGGHVRGGSDATIAAAPFRTGREAPQRRPGEAAAHCALAALALYCAALLGLHAIAKGRALAEASAYLGGRQVRRLAVLPQPADPFRWGVLFETDGEIVAGAVSVLPGASP